MHRFVRMLNAWRTLRDVEHEQQRVPLARLIRDVELTWHGVNLNEPDWGHTSHTIALTTKLAPEGIVLHLIANAWREALAFELPKLAGGAGDRWRRWIDTALASPDDVVELERAPAVADARYRAAPHSVVVLVALTSSVPLSPRDR